MSDNDTLPLAYLVEEHLAALRNLRTEYVPSARNAPTVEEVRSARRRQVAETRSLLADVLPPSDLSVSLHAYGVASELARKDTPFDALIAAAMLRADTYNLGRLALAFPRAYDVVQRRYNAPGGRLSSDPREEQR